MLHYIEKLFNKINLADPIISSYPTVQKSVYFIGLLFIYSFSFFIWMTHFGAENRLFEWEQHQELITVPAQPVHYNIADITFTEPLVSYLPKTWFVGGQSIDHAYVNYIFLFLMIISFTIILTIIHSWKGWLFYIGQLFCIVFLCSLRGDYLLLFSSTTNYFLIISIFFYLGFNYLFRFWFSGTSWVSRWFVYLLITTLIFLIINRYAHCSLPFYQLAVSSLPLAFIIGTLFLILLAVEIPALILRYSRDGFRQFLLTSIAYSILLAVVLLTTTGNISISFLPLDFTFFLLLSVCLGCKGFSQYIGKVVPALGTVFNIRLLYIALSLTLLSVLFLEVQTGNQQLLTSSARSVLYIFLGIAVSFVWYVIKNFSTLLAQRLKVYKVLYDVKNFPFALVLMFGLVLAFFLSKTKNRSPLDYAISGYYNAEGDLYSNTNNVTLAENAYKKSLHLGHANNHAHYALGGVNMKNNDNEKAEDFFQLAADLTPTPQSYVNLGIVNTWNGSRSLAIKYLKNGEKAFPKNQYIRNNLGLEYLYLYMLDSTTHYLLPKRIETSQKDLKTGQQALYNFIGALIILNADILNQEDWTHLLPPKNNALPSKTQIDFEMAKIVYNNAFSPSKDNFLRDEKIDFTLFKAYELGNFLVSNVLSNYPMSDELEHLLDNIKLAPNERLWIKKCYAFWLFNEKKYEKAFETMQKLVSEFSESSSHANEIMGTWALVLNSPRLAQQYLDKIVRYSSDKIRWKKLINAYLLGDDEKISFYHKMYKDKSDLLLADEENEILYEKIKNLSALSIEKEGVLPSQKLPATISDDAFNVEKVMQTIKQLTLSGEKEKAYRLTLEKLKYNRYNLALNKCYLQLAAELGYWFFIEKEQKEMINLMGYHQYHQWIDSLEDKYKTVTF